MGVSGPAGYFWKMGQAANSFATTTTNLDGLIIAEASHSAPLWYSNPANRNLVLTADMDANARLGGVLGRRIIAMPLAADHFNGLAQVVNQLTTGKAATSRE